MSLEKFSKILTEFGKQIDLNALALDEDKHCCLDVNETIELHIQYCSDSNMALLSAPLGIAKPECRERLYPSLLRANLFFQGTSGGALGVEPETGEVIYSNQASCEHLTAESFAEFAEVVVTAAEFWQTMVSKANAGTLEESDMFEDEPVHM